MTANTPPEFDEKEFLREMKLQELADKVLQIRVKVLHQQISDAVLNAEAGEDVKLLVGPEVTAVLKEVLRVTGTKDTGRIDMMHAVRIALLAAWRLTYAANNAARQILDPTCTDDPDTPIAI